MAMHLKQLRPVDVGVVGAHVLVLQRVHRGADIIEPSHQGHIFREVAGDSAGVVIPGFGPEECVYVYNITYSITYTVYFTSVLSLLDVMWHVAGAPRGNAHLAEESAQNGAQAAGKHGAHAQDRRPNAREKEGLDHVAQEHTVAPLPVQRLRDLQAVSVIAAD